MIAIFICYIVLVRLGLFKNINTPFRIGLSGNVIGTISLLTVEMQRLIFWSSGKRENDAIKLHPNYHLLTCSNTIGM